MTAAPDLSTRSTTPRSTTVAVLALVTVGLTLIVLKLLGQSMPVVPPGLVLVGVAAIVMLSVRQRWTAALGVLAGAAEALGVLLAGSPSGLVTLGDGAAGVAILVVTWIRFLASLVAVAASLRSLAARRPQPQVGVTRDDRR